MAKAKSVKEKSAQPVPVLSHREAEDSRNKIREDEAYLAEVTGKVEGSAEHYLPATQVVDTDLGAIQRRINREKAKLEKFGAESHRLSGAERQKAEKERAELGEWLAERMATEAEIGAYPSVKDALKDAVYQQALKKALLADGEHSAIYSKNAERWKYLSRVLYPEDPDASNMKLLRKKGEQSGRHF